MEEKSLEEMMADLSGNQTITVTDGPEITVDMSNQELPEQVQAISQSPVKPEVQEMIEEQQSDFYKNNISKDMDVLEKEYVMMERSAAIIDARILRIKEENKEIFDKIAKLEKAKEVALEHKEDYREVIAHKLAVIGEKKWKGMEVEFTYYAPSFKKTFNKKKFEEEQPKLYARYVEDTPVKEYIKQKLSLLPILPEDLKEE